MFNKKIKKESIVVNVNVLNNNTEHTALIDYKRVCLRDIHNIHMKILMIYMLILKIKKMKRCLQTYY